VQPDAKPDSDSQSVRQPDTNGVPVWDSDSVTKLDSECVAIAIADAQRYCFSEPVADCKPIAVAYIVGDAVGNSVEYCERVVHAERYPVGVLHCNRKTRAAGL
jgi:hypothetical protein